MWRSFQVLLFFSLMAFSLSGCLGLAIYSPGECKNETPNLDARILYHWEDYPPLPFSLTKADILKAWGKPVMINSTSENTETWTYKRHLWCGVMPAFVIAIPLLLPVCNGFERIDFEGDYARRLDIRRIVIKGAILNGGNTIGGYYHPTACRFPLSDNNASHDSAKPATQVPP